MKRPALLVAVALAFAGCAMPRAQRADFARAIKNGAAAHVIPVVCDERLSLSRVQFVGGVIEIELAPILGLTDLDVRTSTATRVSIRDDEEMVGNYELLRNVCAHELGHVLGVSHGTDVAAWMYPTQDKHRALIEKPSADELRVAAACPFDFVLTVEPSVGWEVRAALSWAVAAWNKALGRAAFTVRR